MSETFLKPRKGDIIPIFYQMLVGDITPEGDGIAMPHALSLNGAGELTMIAMAFDGPDLPKWVYRTMRLALAEKPSELIFAMDRWAQPGQSIEFGDFASIHYFDGRAWRFGVVEYRLKPAVTVKEIDWQNQFWIPLLRKEFQSHLGGMMVHSKNTPPIVLPPRGKRPAGFVGGKIPLGDVSGIDVFSRAFPGFPVTDQRESADASQWLEEQLLARGADLQTIEKLAFATGQHIALTDDPWGENQRQLERFIAGEIEEPGDALALRLCDQWMPYFLNMYGPPMPPTPAEVTAIKNRLAEMRAEGFP